MTNQLLKVMLARQKLTRQQLARLHSLLVRCEAVFSISHTSTQIDKEVLDTLLVDLRKELHQFRLTSTLFLKEASHESESGQ